MESWTWVAFVTDSGSEYSGTQNGVGKRLKDTYVDYLIHTHCVAHRAALVMRKPAGEAAQLEWGGNPQADAEPGDA